MLYITTMEEVYGGKHQPIWQPTTLQLEVLTGNTILKDPHPQAPNTTTIACANPMVNKGHPHFNNVVIQGMDARDEEEEWHGHVIAFLRGAIHAGEAYACSEYTLVKYYMIERGQ